MGSMGTKLAMVVALGLAWLLWLDTSPADADWEGPSRRGAPAFRSGQGQEVVSGSYHCDGNVFTDDQAADVSAGAFLSATSGITSGFYGVSQRTADVPADLDAMAEICEAHLARVVSQVPRVCTLGPIERERGEFGNGASVLARFDFSCQGTRDQVIGVIGGFSRLSLTARLP